MGKFKFTEEQELEICRRYKEGEPAISLAKEYNASGRCIDLLLKRNGVDYQETRLQLARKNHLGERHDHLKIIELNLEKREKHMNLIATCKCDCGNTKKIKLSRMLCRSSRPSTCGCSLKREVHGHCKDGGQSTTYKSYRAMLSRCHNKNFNGYEEYGGRGITVCDSWRESFENFLNDMGEKPSPQHSIERKDNNQGYKPSNCIWATKKQQSRNTRSNTLVFYEGELLPVTEAAEKAGLNPRTVFSRIYENVHPDFLFVANRPGSRKLPRVDSDHNYTVKRGINRNG